MDSSGLNKLTMTSEMSNKYTEQMIIPVADAINIGKKLAEEKERRNSQGKGIKALFKPTPGCGCMVFKIEYPEPETFKGCNHPKTKNRNDINREQHLKILSSPNPVRNFNYYKFWCLKLITLNHNIDKTEEASISNFDEETDLLCHISASSHSAAS